MYYTYDFLQYCTYDYITLTWQNAKITNFQVIINLPGLQPAPLHLFDIT